MTYIGKKNFQDKWQDHELGIIDNIIAWTDQISEVPVFSLDQPVNNDHKGWEHKTAPLDDKYSLVAFKDSTINIARFNLGWFDRKGVQLEGVLCSYPITMP